MYINRSSSINVFYILRSEISISRFTICKVFGGELSHLDRCYQLRFG